ncbi:MAG: MFS transporter [Candidatus Hodarchaeales archaeon]
MLIRPLMIFLRTQDLPDRAQTLVQKIVIAVVFMQFVWSVSDTFYVLFVIDSVGYAQLGILIAISFLLQSVLDYPSGALGDWIGQKWVLFTAFITFGLSFAILAVAQSFEMLLVVYCLQAIAASQQSGALITWFDNNYKIAADEADPDRKTYTFFFGRWGLIGNVTGAVSFVIGGFLATVYFRQAVFAFQAVALFVIGVSFLFFVKDFPEVERPKKSVRNYVRLLGQGVQVVTKSKGLLLYMLSICCFGIVWTVWGNMILYPLYFGYTGSDSGASLFRFTVWMVGLPGAFWASNLAARLDIKWIPRLQFLFTILFFPLFIMLTLLFPIEKNIFNIFAIVGTIFCFQTTIFMLNTSGLLQQRLFLDAIPDENRNSFYSLIPTLILLSGAPAVIIGGFLIIQAGISFTIFCLGLAALVGSIFSYIAIGIMTADVPELEIPPIDPLEAPSTTPTPG